MQDALFHLNFTNLQGILAQKIYMRTIFCQFSDIKNAKRSQQPSILIQLVSSEPQHTEISYHKES